MKIDLGSIIGPAGPQGPVGPQGPAGEIDFNFSEVKGVKIINLSNIVILAGKGESITPDKPTKLFFPEGVKLRDNDYILNITGHNKGAICNIAQKDNDGFYFLYTGTSEGVAFDYILIGVRA